uniref:Delta(24)-sterol reductase n=1 Tax=Panagrellus redivivus TaxID=6233 RepID=A0A7E4ZQF1_PANRE
MSGPDPVELSRWERFLEYFLFHFRWVVVIPIVLPLSIGYEVFTNFRNFIVFTAQSAPKAHDRKVALIKNQVKAWAAGDRTSKMCTARSGWNTMSFRVPLYKDSMTKIRTDMLIDILEIDPIAMTVRVEPMVTMGQLTRFLIPLGYTLPIVPELDDLTVGGMINGCGVESSGRKYGLFQHICQSYEIVTAHGELIVATKDKENEHQALFFGIPWSHGTLGLLVAATIRIIPAKPYVRLTYYPCQSKAKLLDRLENAAKSADNEFVEGLQFTHDTGVVMTGFFADSPPVNASVNNIGRWYKPWFFEHVRSICTANQEIVEYIPLRDYYHRHSRSIFWEIKDLVPFGNHPLFRYTLGWAMPPKISLLKRTTPKSVRNIYNRRHVLQDMLIPFDKASEAIDLFHEEVEIYPLWLCPFNLPSSPGLIRQRTGTNIIYVDIGVYGSCELEKYHPVDTTRKLESFVRSVKGVQMLYADTYMTLPEFWEMFDGTLYDWLRVKYGCKDAFPNVYEKINRAVRY